MVSEMARFGEPFSFLESTADRCVSFWWQIPGHTMRLFLSFLSVIFVVASLSGAAFADDKDLVDTKSGLTYIKPPGWALVQTPKKGAVSALHAADDKKSQIEFRFASLTSDKAQQYFTTFHG